MNEAAGGAAREAKAGFRQVVGKEVSLEREEAQSDVFVVVVVVVLVPVFIFVVLT